MYEFNPNLVFLVGFMGAGKSYIGRRLAEKLQLPFRDMDAWIEEEEECTIREIFKIEGEEYFRKLEKNYLRAIPQETKLLLATGGGAPCFFDNMEYMNQRGLTIYLKATPAFLVQRLLKEKEQRPLIAALDHEELLNFIEKKIAERSVFYEQAAISVEINEDGDDIIKEIARYARL